MDAKEQRTEGVLGEGINNGSSNYNQTAFPSADKNKSYLDIGSNSSSKVAVRPCAVIGPDRVAPPQHAAVADAKRAPVEPWFIDHGYQPPPEYPYKLSDYQHPSRNISPRQTFQENMPRIMVPRYNPPKVSEDHNFTVDKTIAPSKHSKLHEAKYPELPYAINSATNEQKHQRCPETVANVNQNMLRPATHGWPPGAAGLRPTNPYVSPEMYSYPEYAACAAPRPLPMMGARATNEEAAHMYPDYYRGGNVRFEPYPVMKDRYRPPRYEYIANYPGPYQPPFTHYPPQKYDLQKLHPSVVQHPHYAGHSQATFLRDPVLESYQRQSKTQPNYNVPYHGQAVHAKYNIPPGNPMHNKLYQYPPSDNANLSPVAMKPPYDPNNKYYVKYDNLQQKSYPTSENYTLNEIPRNNPLKNQMIPNYPINMHHLPYYRKEHIPAKNGDLYPPYQTTEPFYHNSQSRIPTQFSPSIITPSDSVASSDLSHAFNNQEDCGYASQSSTTSIRSTDSSMYKMYDRRYRHIMGTHAASKTESSRNLDPLERKKLDLRQFLQSWNEEDDENSEKTNSNGIVMENTSNLTKHCEVVNNPEQLYVLGLVNVPSDELAKYEHIQTVSKLPENIKGYTSIELLNQFEEAIESSNMNNHSKKPSIPKGSPQVPVNKIPQAKVHGIPNRPISPLDVEAKISQSVIHKDVGCNFEIRPCSPKMLNVQIAAPAQSLLGERHIEKVTNTAISNVMTNHEDKAENNCEVMKRNVQRASGNEDDISAPSCKMFKTQYKESLNFIEPVKTSYSVQDLESNSGVCLASLPRLDNDIELSFPEVNQQFINANKHDSIEKVSAVESTPLNKQSMMIKPNEMNTKIDYPDSSNERKITENCSNLKPSVDVKASELTCVQMQPLRTNSVIIKNPESNDVLNCLVDTTPRAEKPLSIGNSRGKASTENTENEEKNSEKEELKFEDDCKSINTEDKYKTEADVNEIQDLSHKNTEHNVIKNIEDSTTKETDDILRPPEDKTIIMNDISTNEIIDDVNTKNGNLQKSQTQCNTKHVLVNDQSEELNETSESVHEVSSIEKMLALNNTHTKQCNFDLVNQIALKENVLDDFKSKNVDKEPEHNANQIIKTKRETLIPTTDESNEKWECNLINLDKKKNDEPIKNMSGKDKAHDLKDLKHYEIKNKSSDAKVIEGEEKVNKSVNKDLEENNMRSLNFLKFNEVKDTSRYNDESDICLLNTNSFKMFKTHGKNKYVNVDFEIDSETFAKSDISVQPVKADDKINELKWPAAAVIPNNNDEDNLGENNLISGSSQSVFNIDESTSLDDSSKNAIAIDSDSLKESSPAEYVVLKEHLNDLECSATTVVSETHESDSEENTIPNEICQGIPGNISLMVNYEQKEIVDAPKNIQADDVNVDLNICSEAITPVAVIKPENVVTNEFPHVQEDFKNEHKINEEIDVQIQGNKVSTAVLLKKELYSPVFQKLIMFEEGLCLLHKQPQSVLQAFENKKSFEQEMNNSVIDYEKSNGASEKEVNFEKEHGSISGVLENNTTKKECQDNHDPCSEITSDLNAQSEHQSCNACSKTVESIKEGICKQCSLEKKVLQKKFSPIKIRKRRTFKRSLSDSALYSTNDRDQRVDHFASFNDKDCSSPNKRKKDSKDHNSNESNLNEMEPNNYCNLLPLNRRYSISSPYEGNISFCILIDENCIIAEEQDEGGDEGICFTDVVQENLESVYDDAVFVDTTESDTIVVPQVEVPPSEAYTFEYQQEDNLIESWVDDVACVETVVSDNIEDDVNLNVENSFPESSLSDSDDSLTNEDHTRRIKQLYGDEICSNDIDLIKTLYTTPQKDLNRTLQDRDSIFDTDYKDENDRLEQILSGYEENVFKENDKENFDVKLMVEDVTISNEINQEEDRDNASPADETLSNSNNIKEKIQDDDTVKSCDLVNSVKGTILDQIRFKSNPEYKRSSSSPEVTSTTSEEKKSGILMKITNYGGSITSHIDHIDSESKKIRCKLTEASGYYCSKNETISSKPMITKAAQKYIPPIIDELSDLKVKLRLPEQSLTKLKLLKLSKAGPKINPIKSKSSTICNNVRSGAIKKPKPKFEDVLKNIDEVQIKMLKEKSKKTKTTFVPKVIIKKTENGSHYTSRSSKDSFNPDLTGRKWQPWVFIEKNPFIEKMVLRGKRRAIYCHRKKTYILFEKFRKYKSVCTNSSNFVISSPNFEHVSGPLKYTIRLKRDES